MAPRLVAAFALLAPSASGLKLKADDVDGNPHKVSMSLPGAGVDFDDGFKPYKLVLKDGFMKVDCVKDAMFSHGDKYGDNRHAYSEGDRSRTSIVHYAAHVPKLEREPMTHNKCFEFCRTVPDMGFFGILNGRECYCTPFYKPAPGDSSACDAPCDGDNSIMCGGKSKSSIFEMHWCDSTEADLKEVTSQALTEAKKLGSRVAKAESLSQSMQDAAAANQKTFGTAGDPAASDLMQSAKVFAGDLKHAAQDADAIVKDLDGMVKESEGLAKFAEPATVTKATRLMEKLASSMGKGSESSMALGDVLALAAPGAESKGAAKQYYPIMYFIDKKFENVMQTCSGTPIDKPIVGESLDGCAAACDDAMTCVGFSHFGTGDASLCFLFTDFKSAVYYTGCDKAKPVKCMAKLTEFQGINLKPDGSGKCKFCLKKLTKADRCY